MFHLLLFLVISLILVHDYIKKCGSRWKKLREFPGDTPLPLIGNILQLGLDTNELPIKLNEMWKRHGMQNFRLSIGLKDWILLSDADDVKTLLNHTTELSKPSDRNNAMTPFFGDSVSSSEGKKWRLVRKLMSLSLRTNTLEGTVEFVNSYFKNLADHLDTYVDEGVVDLYKYLRPYTFDILSATIFGVETNFLNDLDCTYLRESAKTIRILTENFFSYWRDIGPIFKLTPMYKEMMDSANALRSNSMNIINRRKKKIQQFENSCSSKDSLLDNLLLCQNYNGGPFSDEVICDEITLISFAAHYTIAVTISHVLYCLSKHPDVQEKVLEEQKSILYNRTSDPSLQDLNEMKYLEAVIKETIRTYPTVTQIGRELHNDLIFNDGRIAPAGSTVTVFYEALYNNPEVYPDPEKYYPERFLGPTNTFAFVPFSAGPRSCIGQKLAWVTIKTTVSNLIRRYEFLPGMEPQFVSRVVTESKNGIQLRLRKRS